MLTSYPQASLHLTQFILSANINNMNTLKEKLKEFGFSDKETNVYLALVELGSSVVSAIAKKAGVNRSTAYVVLDELMKRGLVSITDRRGARLFNVGSSEKLAEHFEQAAKQYANLASIAKKMAPELKSLEKSGKARQPRPKVQLFEGKEGIRTVYGEMLSSLEGMRGPVLKKGEFKVSPVAGEEFSSTPQIAVHGTKIILISPEEKFAAVVESQELADKLKKILASARKETKEKLFLKPAI